MDHRFTSAGTCDNAAAVSDEEREADKVTSRARLRIAELLQRPFGVRSIALTGLFVLAVFYTIYFMRSILLPIVLALLLSFLLRPIVHGLARLKIPLPMGAAFILIGLLALVGYGVSALAAPAVGWLQKAPAGLAELQHKLRPLKKSMAQVTQASGEIENLAKTPDAQTRTVEVKRHPITEMLFAAFLDVTKLGINPSIALAHNEQAAPFASGSSASITDWRACDAGLSALFPLALGCHVRGYQSDRKRLKALRLS
jgi:hypothetical protein